MKAQTVAIALGVALSSLIAFIAGYAVADMRRGAPAPVYITDSLVDGPRRTSSAWAAPSPSPPATEAR